MEIFRDCNSYSKLNYDATFMKRMMMFNSAIYVQKQKKGKTAKSTSGSGKVKRRMLERSFRIRKLVKLTKNVKMM